MLEIILFMCLASIAAFMFLIFITYWNIKRKLRGLPIVGGADAFQDLMNNMRKRQEEKQKKTKSAKTAMSENTQVDDAEFREIEK